MIFEAIKEKHICTEDLELSQKADSSEKFLLGTIHMSLGFIVRPFPFFKFLHEVPDVSWSRGGRWRLDFSARWSIFGGKQQGRSKP